MKILVRLGSSVFRPLALFVLGLIAGQTEFGLLALASEGMESVYVGRMGLAAVLGLGMAAMAGVPKTRMGYALTWSLLAGFVSVSYYAFSPLLGRILLGSFLGMAMMATGLVRPIPWLCALRGALGTTLGAVVAHYAVAQGAPAWMLPGLGAVVLGTLLTPSKSEQLRAILAGEIEAVYFSGDAEVRAQAGAVTHMAVMAIEEMEDRQERTGEAVETAREEVIGTTGHLLRLVQRIATLPPRAEHMKESLCAHIDYEESRLTSLYCREVGKLMRQAADDPLLPGSPLATNESQG